MNGLPIHAALVHVPLGLAVFVPLLAVGALAHGWTRGFRTALWASVVGAQLIVTAGAFIAAQTGERDEERIEDRVGEARIHAHEEWAERFEGVSVATLGLAVAALAFKRRSPARAMAILAATSSAAALGVALFVGHSGGSLVFGEGGAGAATNTNGAEARQEASDEDSDR